MPDGQHGTAPVQPALGRARRIVAQFLPFPQPLDVVAMIAAGLRVAGHRLRVHLSAAGVGIQRRPRHPERVGGLGGGEEAAIGHGLILRSILTI